MSETFATAIGEVPADSTSGNSAKAANNLRAQQTDLPFSWYNLALAKPD